MNGAAGIPYPTAKIIREFSDYDPETGLLTWRHRAEHWFASTESCHRWNNRFEGAAAGSVHYNGYLRVTFFGDKFLAHRIIWVWVTGEVPSGEIDHVDHNRLNNAWGNLRAVDRAENCKNTSQYSTNTSGVTGVRWDTERCKWRAEVGRKLLGRFATFNEAVSVRRAAEAAHGYHKNHGRTE